MKKLKNLMFLLGISLMFCTACVKEQTPKLTVPIFDFQTTKTEQLSVDFKTPYVVKFDVYEKNPFKEVTIGESKRMVLDTTVQIVYSGFTNKSGQYSGTFTVPAYMNELYAYTEYPTNLITTRSSNINVSQRLLDELASTFKEGVRLNPLKYADPFIANMIIVEKESDVSITFISKDGTFKNRIGYFDYNDPTNVIYPNFNLQALQTGNTISLGTFKAGTRLGLVIEVHDASNNYMGTFASSETDNDKKQVLMFQSLEEDCHVAVFEDMPYNFVNPWNDRDFNDLVIMITGDLKKINPPLNPPTEFAVINYIGSIAFEDLWPYQGDYDMNDVVIEYHSKVYLNKDNQVVKLYDTWKPVHKGATYKNGFGYQFNISKDLIKSMIWSTTGNVGKPKTFDIDVNGFENNQSLATIMLFDNASENGIVIKSEPIVYIVETDLVSPQNLSFVTPPYNPFLVVRITNEEALNNYRGREVHLSMQKPTDLADTSFFGRGNDLSNTGRFYLAKDNFPFAIQIPVYGWKCPGESIKIYDAYPKFNDWVNSNGNTSKDWYIK